jgi:uncharacterized protein (DUF1697 family)
VKYVALLRGINVGGKNSIRMDALRAIFASLGFSSVATYIQSGNVLFDAETGAQAALTERIETALGRAFAYESKIVLVSADELAAMVADAPPGFGSDPARYRYDVVFVKPPLTAQEAMGQMEATPGVDDIRAGTKVIYFRRLIALATRSRLPKIIGKPVYKSLTIRNWNTTKQLLALLEA